MSTCRITVYLSLYDYRVAESSVCGSLPGLFTMTTQKEPQTAPDENMRYLESPGASEGGLELAGNEEFDPLARDFAFGTQSRLNAFEAPFAGFRRGGRRISG